MNNYKILLVQEDKKSSIQMNKLLEDAGYCVYFTSSGKEACSLCLSMLPDVVLLDMRLSDISGAAVIKDIRKWSQIPIIAVSTVVLSEEIVLSLDLGADDFVVKPFNKNELLARIRVALRHKSTPNTHIMGQMKIYQKDKLKIDFSKRLVMYDNREISLTRIEYKIIELLCRHQGQVLSYEFIMKQIWGPYSGNDNRILRVNLTNIRKKIEPNPKSPIYFKTENGVGYKMAETK